MLSNRSEEQNRVTVAYALEIDWKLTLRGGEVGGKGREFIIELQEERQ